MTVHSTMTLTLQARLTISETIHEVISMPRKPAKYPDWVMKYQKGSWRQKQPYQTTVYHRVDNTMSDRWSARYSAGLRTERDSSLRHVVLGSGTSGCDSGLCCLLNPLPLLRRQQSR